MELQAGALVTPTIRLVRELGAGGMGKVWLADHLALRSQVVVKFMSPELAARPEGRERFSLEAAAASQVRSPHVVQVLDHGLTESGVPYIVMELLEGHDLRHHLELHGRLQPRELVPIVVQTAKALGKAYKRGIIHRDIKPENIFLCEHGPDDVFVKLLDFGIAKTAETGRVRATATGSVMGTAPYMSPEQLLGEKIDHRSDLWSVGVVVYEALTGTLPFKGETIGALTLAIHRPEFPLPSKEVPELGAAIDAFFMQACARSVDDRFASPAALAEAFIEAVARPASTRPGAAQTPAIVAPAAPVDASPLRTTSPSNAPTLEAAPRMHTAGTGTSQPTTIGPERRSSPARWIAAGGGVIAAIVAIAFIAFGGRAPNRETTTGAPEARSASPAVVTTNAPSVVDASLGAQPLATTSNPSGVMAPSAQGTAPLVLKPTPKSKPKPSTTAKRNDASIF